MGSVKVPVERALFHALIQSISSLFRPCVRRVPWAVWVLGVAGLGPGGGNVKLKRILNTLSTVSSFRILVLLLSLVPAAPLCI
jgi:hypothetical protein